MVNFKIYDVLDSTTNNNYIGKHILPNISRSKDSEAIKFGQLIKPIVRNIFFKNHAQN